QEIAARYLKSYHDVLEQLGVQPPDVEPLATEHVVPQMTDLIAKLLFQGIAYEAGGDVYFSVRKFEAYGKLSNRSPDELLSGARVEPGEHKQDPLDFALWKAAKPGEPSWQSPWGFGRPGWHIECSAMSTHYLGDGFDIHGGGVDLVFPHHENEIAQAQAAGKSFARFWIHNGLLTVNSEKMSKSLGNFVTMEDALKRCGGEPDVMKMFFLSAHYRSPIDYTPSNLHAAGRRFDAFDSFCMRVHSEGFLKQHPALGSQKVESDERSRWRGKFAQAMDDDLNTPQALSVLDQLVKYGNQCLQQYEKPPLERSQFPEWDRLPIVICEIYHVLLELGGVLGLFSDVLHDLSKEELALLQEREVARRMRDFKRADDIRRQFADKGFIIEDTVRGPIVRIKRG
ncbi:MAG: cysteine--tRNA ligase, partial [Candidatus Omnitrophica bacterium]|nr:cysteine--tRNA ligase [Candidatus Omnitrophota bacterium]